MKNKISILVIGVIIVCLSLVAYWKADNATFVKSNLIKYTGVKDFIFESEYNDAGQSFIKVILNDSDRRKFLNKYKFESSLDKLKGKVKCPYIQYNNSDFLYFVNNNNGRQYGYILYCLSKRDNTFILYEYFGD
jgi:hypothetical protein